MEKSILILFFALALSACGLSGDSADDTLIDAFSESTGSNFDQSGQQLVEGSGSILFQTFAATDTQAYRLTMNLLSDGAYVELVTNASSSLTGGLAVRFERSGLDVNVTVTVGSGSTQDITFPYFNSQNAGSDLNFTVQVENLNTAINLYIWDDTSLTAFSETNALYEPNDTPIISGSVSDTSWGLTLENAQVTRAFITTDVL